MKASSLKNIRHNPTAKSSRVTVGDYARQRPVQHQGYWTGNNLVMRQYKVY